MISNGLASSRSKVDRFQMWDRPSCERHRKILAVASGGGHWVQLLRIAPAFAEHEVVYVTVRPESVQDLGTARFHEICHATRWNKVGLLKMALQLIIILYRERPDIIVTTGAAPGYLSLVIGKWIGIRARTVWIDSIANAEELSMCGKLARGHADLWLTQWPHLARPHGPYYAGAVL